MSVISEGTNVLEFLISEANGQRSRANGVLAEGNDLAAGAVLGRITASGKFTAVNPSASDGSEAAAGILVAPTDASDADKVVAVIVRDAEVSSAKIDFGDLDAGEIATATAELAALNIHVR